MVAHRFGKLDQLAIVGVVDGKVIRHVARIGLAEVERGRFGWGN